LFRRHCAQVPGLARSDRYVAVEVVPFGEASITSSSPAHVDFALASLRHLFQRCEDEGLVFGFVHNHPLGCLEFSDRDHTNELTLLNAISNRNGKQITMVSMLLCDDKWRARTWRAEDMAFTDARHVAVLDGHRIKLHIAAAENIEILDEEILARQAAAFGKPFVRNMRSLRIGVVGASGTGSPTATLLKRGGVGELIFLDPDALAKSNLNRVRGARLADVGKNKAAWMREYTHALELGGAQAAFGTRVDEDEEALDALATCDVIMGCTDDQIGREILNAVCFAFGVPLIDMGLGGWIDQDASGAVRLRGHYGRVSTVFPEDGQCLNCQGVVTPEGVRRDYAVRENPDITEAELRERYLAGGAEAAPGVGPFTGAVADFAVATLYDPLTGFRKWPPGLRWDMLQIDFVLMEMRSHTTISNADCPFCGTGELLLRRSKYRLGRPRLGVANVAL